MLGDKILVAPVLIKDANERTVILPKGIDNKNSNPPQDCYHVLT